MLPFLSMQSLSQPCKYFPRLYSKRQGVWLRSETNTYSPVSGCTLSKLNLSLMFCSSSSSSSSWGRYLSLSPVLRLSSQLRLETGIPPLEPYWLSPLILLLLSLLVYSLIDLLRSGWRSTGSFSSISTMKGCPLKNLSQMWKIVIQSRYPVAMRLSMSSPQRKPMPRYPKSSWPHGAPDMLEPKPANRRRKASIKIENSTQKYLMMGLSNWLLLNAKNPKMAVAIISPASCQGQLLQKKEVKNPQRMARQKTEIAKPQEMVLSGCCRQSGSFMEALACQFGMDCKRVLNAKMSWLPVVTLVSLLLCPQYMQAISKIGMEQVRKNEIQLMAMLNTGQLALGWLGELYFVSFSWAKKKNAIAVACTNTQAPM